jgi:hypothetical protein
MSIEAVDGQEVDTWVPLSWTAIYQRVEVYTSVCHATQPLPLPPSLYTVPLPLPPSLYAGAFILSSCSQ